MKKLSKLLLSILFLFLINPSVYSFETLLFNPLTANHLESRIGTFYQSNKEKLRLDIGHSLDLMEIANNENYQLRTGGDFFILSRLRSEGKFKFPVETSDFFFGLNLTGTILNDYSFRMRIAHISSHLVDGYTIYDSSLIFIEEPFVYSREFVDLIVAYNTKYFRSYAGGTAIFSTIPKNISKFVPQLGFDFEHPLFNYFNIVGGYDFKLVGIENNIYFGCNSAQIGLKYNLSKNTGLSFNFYYYSGISVHGMFYNNKENYTGFGIQFCY
jgi:hypothetical protein